MKIYKTTILPVVLYGCETWVSNSKGETLAKGIWEQGKVKLYLSLTN
jgi:hypothetical protein